MNPSDKYEQIKDIKRLNPVELEAMVLCHDQQIKDLAAHLLELKQLVTPMMEFKRGEMEILVEYLLAKVGQKDWNGVLNVVNDLRKMDAKEQSGHKEPSP